ncbi:hypothetical protein [Thermogemmatispora sp.]|uniref:hypothetical protein n=1 Tax=Thermogemmatispora sp. TaxID=1968838 RepID=UPI001D74C97F|nr:hypothetical protein [Thermogemmatispora sp.]MBX5448572.1 hypothetical protein [Thermogemmatispora sp.]
MTVSGDAFDRLLEAIYAQQRLLEELERENRELRQQLADLREGRGIFVEILGVRYPLAVPGAVGQQFPEPMPATAAQSEYISPMSSYQPVQELPEGRSVGQDQQGIAAAATDGRLPEITQIRASIGPLEAQQMAQPLPKTPDSSLQGPRLSPSYLEEMLLDEFAAAATGPLGTMAPPAPGVGASGSTDGKQGEESGPERWPGQAGSPSPTALDEERKAALRRELMGSFLLD